MRFRQSGLTLVSLSETGIKRWPGVLVRNMQDLRPENAQLGGEMWGERPRYGITKKNLQAVDFLDENSPYQGTTRLPDT